MKLHVKQQQGSLGMIHIQLNVFLELPLGVFSEMYFLFIINGVVIVHLVLLVSYSFYVINDN